MSGKVKNCPVCGKLFADYGTGMCMDCVDKQQEMEKKAVDYVREHPKAKIMEIVEETGVSEAIIKKLIREGRFEQVGVKVTYPCEKCGAPIMNGKICQQCSEKIRHELQAQNAQLVAARQAARTDVNRGQGMRSKALDGESRKGR